MLLKRTHPSGYEEYQDLGQDFGIIRKADVDDKFWATACKVYGQEDDEANAKTISFVLYGSGKSIRIYELEDCKIMSNDGHLFKDLDITKE